MAEEKQGEWLVPTTGAKTLPAVEILTGRGFVTGKSGSGKSNTANVIAEQLLDNNYNLLVVDPEGEYYGLKEKYEILHVGNDELCDVQVTPNHAGQIAEIALERNMPVILDVSDYLDAEEAKELIANTVRELFQKEKDARKPFLLMIEEMQEYLPQQGGNDELSELLERVAKRGRKRGLGMLGMSQRPSSVDKDFITQCDWMVWHRLSWETDIDVVRKVLGKEVADEVEKLETGEGYLMTDWDESVERVQFKRKETHDAGATPGLESYERPDLKSVSQDLVQEIKGGDQPQDNTEQTPELSSDAQEELDSVVESVQAEGGAIADQDPNHTEDTSASAGEALEDSLPEQVDDIDGERDLSEWSREELEERVERVQRRNQILEDEVSELRTVLEGVEDQSGSRSRESHQPQSNGNSKGGRTADSDPATPSRPTPPEPPVQRRGVAGNLVELVSMVGYLCRSASYRCKLIVYRARYGDPEA
jgi:predicted CoA-binding protein